MPSINVSDTISTSESLSVGYSLTVFDSRTVAELVNVRVVTPLTPFDSIGQTESVSLRLNPIPVSVSDSPSVSDVVVSFRFNPFLVGDSITVTESVSIAFNPTLSIDSATPTEFVKIAIIPFGNRLTQEVIEVFYSATSTKARLTQEVIEVFYTGLSTKARLTQLVLEVFGKAAVTPSVSDVMVNVPVKEFVQLQISSARAFLQKTVSKKVYFLTLTLRYVDAGAVKTENLYLSNFAYNTTATETPPNTEFIAVLADTDIPDYYQELSGVFYGTSLPSFGTAIINNADAQFDSKLPPTREWEGGQAELDLSGDRQELALSEGMIIFTAYIGKIQASDNKIAVEIVSRHKKLERTKVPVNTTTGANNEKIFKPVVYGYCKNVSPILTDAVNLTYIVADHEVENITDVYFDGVRATAGELNDYVVNLATATITLKTATPAVVTCDVMGKKINGVFSAKRGDFIYDLLTTYGGLSGVDIDTTSFTTFNTEVPGDSGIYLPQENNILDIIVRLLRPVMGYLSFNRVGTAQIGVFKLPTESPISIAAKFTDNELIPVTGDATSDSGLTGDVVQIRAAEFLYYRATFLYDQNNTVQTEDSLGGADPVNQSTPNGLAR